MLIGTSWAIRVFNELTFHLDKVVYKLAKIAYDVFMFIADARILNNATAANLTRRVYAILGIFMLFVLAYNLLMYIIDPDKMVDKEKGMGRIIKDVLIALAIILILPVGFNRLYGLQSMVLKSGVIENLVLGGYTEVDNYNPEGENSASERIEKGVNVLIANSYSAFLLPGNGELTALDCIENEDNTPDEAYCSAYQEVRRTGDISPYEDFVTNDNYRFWPLVSTVAGIALIFFLLSFCLNLAIRAGKLAILQLIAPIPLVLEILPNRHGTRKRWLETLGKTYVEVFIFLAMIYLVVFLISLIPDVIIGLQHATFGDNSASTITHLIAVVILSFGLLQFGKTAPEFVYDILGIKSKGTLLAAAKRAFNIAGATGAGIGTAAILGRRNIGTMYNDLRKDVENERPGFKSLGKGVFNLAAGTTIGAFRGAYNNRSGGARFGAMRSSARTSAIQTQNNLGYLRGRPQRVNEFMTSGESLLDRKGRSNFREIFTNGINVDKEINALKSATGSVKDKGKEDALYKEIEKEFNKTKSSAAISGYNWDAMYKDWKKDSSHKDATQLDFANEIINDPNLYNGGLLAAAQRYKAMEEQRTTVNNDQKQKDYYKNIAVKYLTEIERSSDIKINSVKNADIKEAVDELRNMFKDGKLDNGELIKDVNGSDIFTGSDILGAIKKIDDRVKKREIEEEINITRRTVGQNKENDKK